MLETYAENTERLVREKTLILQEERDRVDKLSAMFLPEYCIQNLRNNAPIDPKYYENGM